MLLEYVHKIIQGKNVNGNQGGLKNDKSGFLLRTKQIFLYLIPASGSLLKTIILNLKLDSKILFATAKPETTFKQVIERIKTVLDA